MTRCKICNVKSETDICGDATCHRISLETEKRVKEQQKEYNIVMGKDIRICAEDGCDTELFGNKKRKYCPMCATERKRARDRAKNEEQKAERAKTKRTKKDKGINPMFLVRGEISDSTRASNF